MYNPNEDNARSHRPYECSAHFAPLSSLEREPAPAAPVIAQEEAEPPVNEVPQDVQQEAPRSIPQAAPEQMPQEMSQDLPREIPQEIPREEPRGIPRDIPSEARREVPRSAAPAMHTAPAPAKPPKSIGMGKLIAVALVCSLLGGLIGAAIMSMLGPQAQLSHVYEGEREPVVLHINSVDTSKELTCAEVYAANVNSTVGITTTMVTTNFWGHTTTAAASGSGFVYTKDGYILTNYHVVEGANAMKVSTYDGSAYDAIIVGYDQSNDIAVLKVEAEDLTPVVLGDSDAVNVGDAVVAIGNPLGELTFSLTSGVVSALDREVTFSGGMSMDLIQTDCAINSGNSGGALFNLYGEVIGITNAKYSSSKSGEASIDNIGFAIPLNSVRGIVDSIIEKGIISKPYLGISVLTMSESVMAYGLPAGASIQEVVTNGPADKAGLEVNDIITAVDGVEVTTSTEVVNIVGDSQPGDVLTFTIYRSGSYMDIEVTVGEQITQMGGTGQQAVPQRDIQQDDQGYNNFSFPWSR